VYFEVFEPAAAIQQRENWGWSYIDGLAQNPDQTALKDGTEIQCFSIVQESSAG